MQRILQHSVLVRSPAVISVDGGFGLVCLLVSHTRLDFLLEWTASSGGLNLNRGGGRLQFGKGRRVCGVIRGARRLLHGQVLPRHRSRYGHKSSRIACNLCANPIAVSRYAATTTQGEVLRLKGLRRESESGQRRLLQVRPCLFFLRTQPIGGQTLLRKQRGFHCFR